MSSAPIAANQLDVILRNVADGITAQRPDGSLAYANDAAARLVGLETGEEMISLPPSELMHRFTMIRDDREPFDPDDLPGRRTLASKQTEEGIVGYRLLPDGEERWSFVRATPILAEDGDVELVINVVHDVTAERIAQERARLVDETGAVFAASIDIDATFDALAALLVPSFADYCIVDLIEMGPLRQVAISHRDPGREQLLRELRRRYPPDDNPAHPVSQVLRTGEPYLVEDAREDALVRAAVDEEHLDFYRRLEATSYIVVPLEARGRLLGTISLGTGESRRQFTRADLSLAHEVARRAALAIDNALLFETAQQSYAQLNTLLVSAPVGIGFWDRELRFVRVNDALAAINGLTPEEHVGRELAEVVGDQLAPVLVPLYRRVLETGEPVVHTESTADAALQMGERRHWLSSYYPVRTADGEVIGIGAVIMEITDRKRADDRLRLLAEAGELFSTSLEQDEIASRIAQVGVPRLADTCNVYIVRDRILVRVACVAADRDAQPVLESLPSSFSLEGEVGQVADVFRQGEPLLLRTVPDDYLDELERLGADRAAFERIGTRSLMLVPIVAGGETLGILTLGSRVPDRFDEHDLDLGQELAGRAGVAMVNARLVGELRSRAQAAQALEFVGDGVFLVDRDGVIQLWNPAAARITGLPEEQAVGAAADTVLAGWPLGQAERPQTFPVEAPDTELWLSLTAAEFADGTVYAFRDLTEERAVEQLKSDFVSTVSHELRTPLAAIYGAAMTLRRGDVELNDTQEAGMLEVIAGESERLARIVNDILLASRLDSGAATVEIGRTDATELARGVLAAAEAHLPAAIELALISPDPGPQVAADPDGLRQVLVNLVENAIKYSPEGGLVELELAPANGRVRFAVRDRGLGIPASEHERIFEKFFRIDPNLARGVGGTGLGLYISREIVRRMGGRIRVESEPGTGSTFSFELPLA